MILSAPDYSGPVTRRDPHAMSRTCIGATPILLLKDVELCSADAVQRSHQEGRTLEFVMR